MPAFTSATESRESRRLQYLHAMGITSYFPRCQLPGAAPSPMRASEAEKVRLTASQSTAVPVADSAEALSGQIAPAAHAERHAASSLARQIPSELVNPPEFNQHKPDTGDSRPAGVKRDTTEHRATRHAASDDAVRSGAAVATQAVSTNATADAATEDSTPLHFQLLLFPVDTDLVILAQIPALAASRLQQTQQQLLGNILRWLGKTWPANTAPRVFKWPLPGVAITNNRKEAGASLTHFLEQAAIEQPFRACLLLGEQAAECLDDSVVRHAKAKTRPWPWQLHATHSLDEMLALPSLKREVWQSLLPLHAALERSISTTG